MTTTKNTFTLAGHEFTLKNIQYGLHSEETVDFMADLYCDGKFLCSCENDGHGGATFTHCTPETREQYYKVLDEVGKEVWITCMTGDILYHNLGTVADEVLALIQLNKTVTRLQKDSLVIMRPENSDNYDPYIYTRKVGSIKALVQNNPGMLAEKIAEARNDGWEVLNTNIPREIYESASGVRGLCISKKK